MHGHESGWLSCVWSCIMTGLPTHLVQKLDVGTVPTGDRATKVSQPQAFWDLAEVNKRYDLVFFNSQRDNFYCISKYILIIVFFICTTGNQMSIAYIMITSVNAGNIQT